MSTESVLTISITPEQYAEITNSGAGDLTININYYYDEPEGYEIIGDGPGAMMVLCAKPCPRFTLPKSQA